MRARSRVLSVSILVLAFFAAVFVLAPRSEANNSFQDPPAPPAGGGQEQPQGPTGRPTPSTDPRPYDRVVTKDAKTDAGVSKGHTSKDRVYDEIPKSERHKEFISFSQIARTTRGRRCG